MWLGLLPDSTADGDVSAHGGDDAYGYGDGVALLIDHGVTDPVLLASARRSAAATAAQTRTRTKTRAGTAVPCAPVSVSAAASVAKNGVDLRDDAVSGLADKTARMRTSAAGFADATRRLNRDQNSSQTQTQSESQNPHMSSGGRSRGGKSISRRLKGMLGKLPSTSSGGAAAAGEASCQFKHQQPPPPTQQLAPGLYYIVNRWRADGTGTGTGDTGTMCRPVEKLSAISGGMDSRAGRMLGFDDDRVALGARCTLY